MIFSLTTWVICLSLHKTTLASPDSKGINEEQRIWHPPSVTAAGVLNLQDLEGVDLMEIRGMIFVIQEVLLKIYRVVMFIHHKAPHEGDDGNLKGK